MLYEVLNLLEEVHGQDYFAPEIEDEEHGVSKEDKKLNKEFYGGNI